MAHNAVHHSRQYPSHVTLTVVKRGVKVRRMRRDRPGGPSYSAGRGGGGLKCRPIRGCREVLMAIQSSRPRVETVERFVEDCRVGMRVGGHFVAMRRITPLPLRDTVSR